MKCSLAMAADGNGRHRREGQGRTLDANSAHARIYCQWRHYEAFRTLTPLQRVLLEDMLMDFSKVAGNEVRLAGKTVAAKYGVGHKRARETICGLEERGWIERIGFAPGPTGQAGGLYRILCIGRHGLPTAGPYMTWKPREAAKRKRDEYGSNKGARTNETRVTGERIGNGRYDF
ncbi:MAG: hypothetical protein ACK4MQ_00145 [Hyphomonas sp.]